MISKFEWGCVVGLWLVTPQIKIHTMTFATGMHGLGFVPHMHMDDKWQRQRLGSVFADSRGGGGFPIGPSRNCKMFWHSKNVCGDSARFSKWRPLPMPVADARCAPVVVGAAVLATKWAQTKPRKTAQKITFKGDH